MAVNLRLSIRISAYLWFAMSMGRSGLLAKQNSPSDTLTISDRHVVFYTHTQSEYDTMSAIHKEEMDEALADFYYYSDKISNSLRRDGIDSQFATARTIRIENDSTIYLTAGKDYNPISTILINPKRRPEIIDGVGTAAGLLPVIETYFAIKSVNETSYDWEALFKVWNAYLELPSADNAQRVYQALPADEHVQYSTDGDKNRAHNSISEELGMLERQVYASERNAVKVAFRMFNISDGAFSQTLDIILGGLIRIEPKLFLEELREHRHLVVRLDALLGNFGPEYVDRSQAMEFETKMRQQALEKVTEPSLLKTRNECLKTLRER